MKNHSIKKTSLLICVLFYSYINAQTISTIAGNGISGYSGNGGQAILAKLSTTNGIAIDATGIMYVSDYYNHVVRKIDALGIITTYAGTAIAGYSGDGGAATSAKLNYPTGLAVDASGNLYIADKNNSVIRKVNAAGVISTLAGTGTTGYSGDGGNATTAKLYYPAGVAVDNLGNVYIGDSYNQVIRKVNTSGIISTIAGNNILGYGGDGGNATTASLNYPWGLTVDLTGNIYIGDEHNNVIRKVNTSGIISTIAGTSLAGYSGDGSVATSAKLNTPNGVAVDATGNIYITDVLNNVIRKVNTAGIITTYAGNNTAGYSGDGGPATTAQLNGPTSIAVDAAGNVYFTDGNNHVVRKVTTPNPILPDARFTSSEPGCLGQLENFYSIMPNAPGISHSWNFGSGASPATSTLDNPVGIVYSTAGAKLVTHIVTTSSGSDTIVNIITINPSPTSSFSSTAPVCEGNTVTFTNTGSTSAGVTYSWDLGSGASPALSTAQNPSGIEYITPGTKTITLTVTNQFGCVTSATQSIVINSLPIIDAGNNATICANTSIQIGSNSVGGNDYSWDPSLTLNNSTIANPVASPIAPTTQYILSVTNTSNGCTNHDTIIITMLAPMYANAGIDVEICRFDSVQIGTGLIEGQFYSWSPGSGLNDNTLPNPVSNPDSTTTYTLTVTANGCQAVTDEVTIIVHQLPIANAGMDDTTTVGKDIQLIATGGVQYSWSPSTGLNNSGIYNPAASLESTTTYIVTVTDIYTCINTDTVKITVLAPSFWLPTAFTPDGNGENDIFYVRGEGIQDFEFKIFNRWGEQIFYSKNINQGWDGKRQIGGEELPEGAYVYYVKGILSDATPINANGLINLIR